jgi:RNA polymerase sigma-54 factor
MKFNLSTKQSSKLAITPQLQNAIKLLQFTAVEINQEIQNIFESNPLIEKEDICEELQENICVDHYSHYDKDYAFTEKNTISTSEIIEKTSSEEDTLKSYLYWQINLLNISNSDKSLAETIIDYINDDGYLIKDIFEIFDDIYKNTDKTLDELIAVQHLLQNLDPIGTCTKNIQESLLVQIQNSKYDPKLLNKASTIINEFFEELTNNNIKTIQENLKISQDDIAKIQIIIKEQNARPGSVILNKDNYDYIIPDIKISKKNDEWIIKNNKMVSPEIKVNKNYTNMSEKNMSEEDKIFIKNSLQEAKLFIKNINYRNDTLLRLAKCIFKKQIKFFSYGIEKLVPMNLKEIAILMNVHESTISRLSNGKYMETPYGVFELKFFFSSSIQNIDGSDFSSKSIKEKIKNIINSENKKNPYSDNKIKDILFKENIKLARRTVAKYRESLNFESSSKRKTK